MLPVMLAGYSSRNKTVETVGEAGYDGAMKILLIESAPDHARARLRHEGLWQGQTIELETAGELAAGLDLLGAGAFDLVLVDLDLPDSRGLDTFGQVRSRAPELPIVVLVALADIGLGLKAVEQGAEEYLLKDQLDSFLLVPALRYASKRHQLMALWAAEGQETQTREANYRHLVAGMADALAVVDTEANVLFLNPRAKELAEFTKDDSNVAWMIDAAQPEKAERVEVHDADGGLKQVELRVAPIRWNGRKAFLLALRDAPEAPGEEPPLPYAGELDELILSVANEQRGALASTSGFLELLSRGKVTDPAVQQEFYENMQQQIARLTALVDHLPDLVRIGTDRLSLELEEVDLGSLVAEVVLTQEGKAREKDLAIEVSVPRERWRVQGDRNRLHEMLLHLLDNAIKFSSGPGTIRISGDPGEDQVTIRIEDCGPGVPPEARLRIFDRFFQASSDIKRKLGGSGIGLYKARKIIEAHGGCIGVDKEQVRGSMFFFSLPAEIGPEPEPEIRLAPAAVRPAPAAAAGAPGASEAVPQEPAATGADVTAGLHVIWLSGGSCDGCTMSLLGASNPGIEDLLLGNVPDVPPVTLVHPVLALESGDEYLAILNAAAGGELGAYVVVLEGSLFDESLAGDGYFSHMGEEQGRPLTVTDWIDRLTPGASALIAIGTCATGGGIPAARGSVTGAMSLDTYLGDDFTARTGVPIVNVPGCAPSGEAFIETLVAAIFHLLGLTPLELDEEKRPRWLYSQKVYPMPPRAGYMPEEAYATEGRPSVGCPVHSQGWMNRVGGCANIGGACIGCTAPDFADRYLALTRLNPGTPATAVD